MKTPLLILAGCVLLASCKKDESSGNSRKDLLTASAWVYQSGGLDANKDGSIELSFEAAGAPACLLDNKGTFYANGTGLTEEGATKCDPQAPASAPFTWSLANNDTQLAISGSGFAGISGNLTIKTLTSSQLTLSKDTSVLGIPAAVLINLKH